MRVAISDTMIDVFSWMLAIRHESRDAASMARSPQAGET